MFKSCLVEFSLVWSQRLSLAEKHARKFSRVLSIRKICMFIFQEDSSRRLNVLSFRCASDVISCGCSGKNILAQSQVVWPSLRLFPTRGPLALYFYFLFFFTIYGKHCAASVNNLRFRVWFISIALLIQESAFN